MSEILKEAEFYNLQGFIKACNSYKKTLFPGSTLLADETHQQKIAKWLPWNNTNFKLLHKASRDGWDLSKSSFQGPIVILLRSENGYLFGGYTFFNGFPFSGYAGIKDDSVFLFSLTNPHTKFPYKDPGYSITAGFHFVGGFQVNGQNCTFQFPYNSSRMPYADTTGKGANLFTGSKETTLSDMEVFQCIR
jgi:hypothetical protein